MGQIATLDELKRRASLYRRQRRRFIENKISYVVLVPTLRCNLSCSYCQVSRVSEQASGFDWSDQIEAHVIDFLGGLECNEIKIEFQGGEPLLALGQLTRIRNFVRQAFASSSFVVCSNLQHVSHEAWQFLGESDTQISTSIDGSARLHQKQRTITEADTDQFFANIDYALKRFGPEKLSALPTLDVEDLPNPVELIELYRGLGLTSIYLRPIAYHGFARKRHVASDISVKWNAYRRQFMRELIEYNFKHESAIEEYYFSHCLRRVLRPDSNGHVDLRSPNLLGRDYILIDFDGRFYPSDEARMLTRIGQIDLSVGSVETGIENEKLHQLNAHGDNETDARCQQCQHQPYCGRDVIDDLARYGTIDLDRHETEFCQRHMDIFNQVHELLTSNSPAVQWSLARWSGVVDFDPLLRRYIS